MLFSLKLLSSVFILLLSGHFGNAWFTDLSEHRSSLFSELNKLKDLEALDSEVVPDSVVPPLPEKNNEPNKEEIASDLLSSILQGGLGFPHGLSFLKEITRQPWWKGPEVCISKVEQTVNNSQTELPENSPFIFLGNAAFSTCRNTLNKYICTNKVYSREQTKTTEVIYQCCPGARKNHDTSYCEHVDIKSLDETATKLGATEFSKAMGSFVKKSVLETPNMTVFVPSDAAVNSYLLNPPKIYASERVVHAAAGNKSAVENDENEIQSIGDKTEKKSVLSGNAITSERALNHFVPGVFDVHELENEEILKTIDGLPIRVNIYHGERKPIITANCAVVKSANHPIENGGLLHVTDAILPQITKSIRDILLESEDFKMFTQFAADADLMDKLNEDGNYTVFVATDAAFDKLSEDLRSNLKNKKSCLKTLMKAHIVPRTLCSGAFGRLTLMTKTLSGNWLTIEKGANNSLLVGKDSETNMLDIVASNGVIHVIDNLIVPKSAQPVTSLLAEKNHTKWLDLMKKAGFNDDSDQVLNQTMFVPTEEAIEKAKLDELNVDELKEVISLHVSDESYCSCQMKNNLMIPSKVPDQDLRITTYETSGALFVGLAPKIMVQCASIIEEDEKTCDTMVHEVDKVLTPTTKTIFEKINNDPALGKLKQLLENTTLYNELKNGSLGPVTLLAPTENAFANLTDEEWKTLEDKTMADELLRRHIVTDVVCCDGVGMSTWPFSEEVNTANGFSMNVRRKNKSSVIFGETATESCDHLTKDGLIHYVDKVMMPRPINMKGSAVKYMDPNGSEIVLFGL